MAQAPTSELRDCDKHEGGYEYLCYKCELDRLYTALHEYGEHHEGCSYFEADDTDVCDCGFNEAWEAKG